MIRYYSLVNNELVVGEQIPLDLTNLVWIDIYHPNKEEELALEAVLGIDVPTREEMHEIEVSSRLYSKDGARYITATVVAQDMQEEYSSHSLTFILKDNLLITLHYFEIAAFNKFIIRQKRRSYEGLKCGLSIFIGLLEIIIDQIADHLELIGLDLDDISKIVFKNKNTHKTNNDLQMILKKIGHYGDINGKERESLLSLTRALNYLLLTASEYRKLQNESLETFAKDLASLAEHGGYINGRVNLLLNATMGMINIEQNAIIKIFSVAAVVFLPPTLIASIYGMNFHHMPELSWSYGYPFAICLMIISALLPYYFFKRKRWL